ncbi:MAG: PAS domain S-box protein [Synechococcales cyanobacterium C42_A2020_086]|nr:PAS domain S-box protein [Synechococcales cyanobacterium C42_A2020_086]
MNSEHGAPSQQITVSLTPTALHRLEAQAQQRGLSSSELLEHLIEQWVQDLSTAASPQPPNMAATVSSNDAQQQLAELEAIYTTAPIGLCFVDCNLRFVRINEHLAAINGVPVAEHLGHTLSEVLPEMADQLVPLFQQVLDSGEPILNLEVTGSNSARPGVIRHWLVSYYPLKGEKGQVLGVNAMVQETTERKRIERDLSQANQRITALLENMTDAFVALDQDWRITYMNSQAVRLTDLTLAEVLGKTQWQVWPWSVGRSIEFEYRRAVAEQVPAHFEFLYEPTMTWYEVHAYPAEVGLGIFFRDISERKHIEAALRQSEERLRLAVEGAGLGLWEYNLQSGELYWTDRCKTLYGLSVDDEVSYATFSDLIHPDDRERVHQSIDRLIADPTQNTCEYRILCPDGSLRWILAMGQVDYDAQGQPMRTIGISQDITERKQAEIRSYQSEQRFRAVQELSIDGFILLQSIRDASGRIIDFEWLYANPAAARIVGRPVTELVGQRLLEIVPGNRTTVFETYVRVAETGQPSQFELFYEADGIRDWFRITVVQLDDGVAISFGKITDRKQAEAAVRDAEARLRLALESAEIGTWDWNPISGELQWDDRCKAIFGLSPEAEVTFETHLAGVHPDDRERLQQTVQRCLDPANGGKYSLEYRTIGIEDGIERWVVTRGRVFFNAAGQATRFLGTILDMTVRKQAEAEREQLLAREQAAREQAEAANRIKDEFLAVLSHELRSPLNPILGWTQLLRSRSFDPDTTERALETIERNVKLQTQLIEDLLDVSRILRGKLVLNVAPVHLPTVIEAAIETVHLSAEAKGIQILPFLSPMPEQILGDAARLQQIVWNLLSNAIKFTPAGGRVEVRLEEVENRESRIGNRDDAPLSTPHSYAQITINDTGKGIDPEFLPYVFDSFRQEDGRITRKFGGLGLGLAIVRHLTELHGGTVTAASAGANQGACFTVRLPLLQVQTDSPEVMPPDAVLSQAMPLTDLDILIVDDEADMRELLACILQLAGAQVRLAASAAEALDQIRQRSPDVLISDIGMPEVDGYTLLQWVNASRPEQRPIPAIALTAYAGEANHRRALAAGFQRHLAKPVEPTELVQVITTLVSELQHRAG